jgi:hypothetical protein
MMKNKIVLFLLGCLFIMSCSEEFITKDFDKSRYNPETFYTTKTQALLALNASYSSLSMNPLFAQLMPQMPNAMSDDLYGTGYIAGSGNWGSICDIRPSATHGEIANIWNGCFQGILACNTALEKFASIATADPTFTQDMQDSYNGQVYFLRAHYYYILFTYFPENRLPLRKTPPKTPADYTQAPATADEIYAFIEADLKQAQDLLKKGLNNTSGYDKGRATRGAATALLGKLYLYKEKYQLAADQFKLLLPGVGDATYGTYSLVNNYRDNFTRDNENNSESIFEVQFANVNSSASQGGDGAAQNEMGYYGVQFTLNRTTWSNMWWNYAIPKFRLNEFESWTENIGGVPTTVYDYRVYASFWGVPNGANFTEGSTVKNWIQQGWDKEKILLTETGVFGLRKYSYDATSMMPSGTTFAHTDYNWRLIRLADVMLMYADCLSRLNPSNVAPGDVNSAVYWVDQVRTRANRVMTDQSHLYSARTGLPGQLPTATALMASKGWTMFQLIRHERYVELYCEGHRFYDLKRWKAGPGEILYKSGYTGYQSLTLPVPQTELDNNPLNRGN